MLVTNRVGVMGSPDVAVGGDKTIESGPDTGKEGVFEWIGDGKTDNGAVRTEDRVQFTTACLLFLQLVYPLTGESQRPNQGDLPRSHSTNAAVVVATTARGKGEILQTEPRFLDVFGRTTNK